MEFPSNNKLPKPPAPDEPKTAEEKKIDPVVTGEIVRRKKPLGKRFAELFFSGEAPKSIAGFVIQHVIVPSAKDMFSQAVIQGVERMVYGDSARSYSQSSTYRSNGSSKPYFQYSRSSAPARREESRDRRPELSREARANHDFQEVIIPTRAEAMEVRDGMFHLMEKYDEVSVSDFYRLCGITPQYTDENWGWKDIRGTEPHRDRSGGYVLTLPRPEPLKS